MKNLNTENLLNMYCSIKKSHKVAFSKPQGPSMTYCYNDGDVIRYRSLGQEIPACPKGLARNGRFLGAVTMPQVPSSRRYLQLPLIVRYDQDNNWVAIVVDSDRFAHLEI